MIKRLRVSLLAILLACATVLIGEPAYATPDSPDGCQTDPAAPKRQLRGMWLASVVNIDWPSKPGLDQNAVKSEYLGWLDLAASRKLNAIYVQVRPTADAFWPSPLEPWSEYLTGVRGKDPGWDPLAFLVDEAHKRNLEFHAWFNPYRVSMPVGNGGAGIDIDKLAPNHPVRNHRDWVVPYPNNPATGRLVYNPGIPEVRTFVEDAMLDAVRRYDIDGVHFDDYFYPYPVGGEQFADADTFARYGAGFDNIADWRRHNIDMLVQEMGKRTHQLKPFVKFGISPFGIWRNKSSDPNGSETSGTESYSAIYADTRKWVKQEWVDYLMPQVYWNIGFAVADYAKLMPWWAEVAHGTHVQMAIGQAAYRVGVPGQAPPWQQGDELLKHLLLNRQYPDIAGDVYFSAKDVRADRLGWMSQIAQQAYAKPALVPAMPQLGGVTPHAPVITTAARGPAGVDLAWQPLSGNGGATTSYAVYRLDGRVPVPGCALADATHLLTTIRGTSFTDQSAEPGKQYTYFVTALNRTWDESRASAPRIVN